MAQHEKCGKMGFSDIPVVFFGSQTLKWYKTSLGFYKIKIRLTVTLRNLSNEWMTFSSRDTYKKIVVIVYGQMGRDCYFKIIQIDLTITIRFLKAS